jgi:hypothetical protein
MKPYRWWAARTIRTGLLSPCVRALDRKSSSDGYGVCELETSRTSDRIVAARSSLASSIG